MTDDRGLQTIAGEVVMIATVHPDGSVVFVAYGSDVVEAVRAVAGTPVAEALLSAEECAMLNQHNVGVLRWELG